VVVGGLALSALLTLLVVPPMLAMLVGPIEGRKARAGAALDPGRRDQLTPEPEPAAGE
jgi:HAE1 family hydrophobic/amphiphilic exporter-1